MGWAVAGETGVGREEGFGRGAGAGVTRVVGAAYLDAVGAAGAAGLAPEEGAAVCVVVTATGGAVLGGAEGAGAAVRRAGRRWCRERVGRVAALAAAGVVTGVLFAGTTGTTGTAGTAVAAAWAIARPIETTRAPAPPATVTARVNRATPAAPWRRTSSTERSRRMGATPSRACGARRAEPASFTSEFPLNRRRDGGPAEGNQKTRRGSAQASGAL